MAVLGSTAHAQTREASESGVRGAAKVTRWISHHKRFLLAAGAIAGASVIQWKASTYCERGEPAFCNTGYGAKDNHQFVIFTAATGAALLGASAACWKDDPSWKPCYALAYGTPAAQTAFGIHDFLNYQPKPKGESDEKATLHSFARTRVF